MGVHNTTGKTTLFIDVHKIINSAQYVAYCRAVGTTTDQIGILRSNAWYALDISMVLNAMLHGKGVTDLMRMQQCTPPMPASKYVYTYLDAWYKAHGFSKCVLVFVFDGRRCTHKLRNKEAEEKVFVC